MLIKQVPFYKNTGNGNQCLQVSMQSVLEYFLGKKFNLKKLDKMTGHKDNFWSWTVQGVSALNELDLLVDFYSKMDISKLLEGEIFLQDFYGDSYLKIKDKIDIGTMIKATNKVLLGNNFIQRQLNLNDIEKRFRDKKKDWLAIVLINENKIQNKKKKEYVGHFVVVTGFDDEHIYYHDSGPKNSTPNKKIKKNIFEKAWQTKETDGEIIFVSK